MRLARTSAIGVAAGAALLLGGSGSAAAAPGNCVANFTSTLGQAGAAGVVISGGAHMFVPFGANVVRNEAHATLGACPFNPEDYLPPPG